jgi:hypothetical protein
MNAQQHVPVEDLAAYAAGDLDATAAVAVETHLVLCAECRADVEAVTQASAALASVERPAMPADVAARVDAALLAAAAPPAGDIVPLHSKRRRPSFAGIAAVAAGIALVGAIAVPLLHGGSAKQSASNSARGAVEAPVTRRLASGLDYTHTTLAATLKNALSAPKSVSDVPVDGASGPPLAPVPAPTSTPAQLNSGSEYSNHVSLTALESDPARLAACVSSLATGLPAQAATPVVVDFALFAHKPAVVVAFPTVTEGKVRTDRIDVFVVGPACGLTPGEDDVLDFARIARPPGV